MLRIVIQINRDMSRDTYKVHAGVEVVFSVGEGSLVPNVLEVRTGLKELQYRPSPLERPEQDFIPEENLTVRDIIKLRKKHNTATVKKF